MYMTERCYELGVMGHTGLSQPKEIQPCQTENENDGMTPTELGVNGTRVIAPAAFSDGSG
jgi:hypothetical protein